jgi:hypothetical protein
MGWLGGLGGAVPIPALVREAPTYPRNTGRGFFVFAAALAFSAHPPIAAKKPSSGELSKPLEAPPSLVGAAHTASS